MAIFNRPNNDTPASIAQRAFQFIWTLAGWIYCSQGGILLGRQTGAGAAEEIVVGDGLALVGGVLSVSGGGAAVLELTAAPINGTTTAEALCQFAVVTIAGARKYTFQCVDVAGKIWVGTTAGLIYDSEPATGVARWKFLRFTGTGDDRTVFYDEL